MKKTYLCAAIVASLLSASVMSAEVYHDDKNTVTIGGYIDGAMAGGGDDSLHPQLVDPQINFAMTKKVGNGVTVDALAEFGINDRGGKNGVDTRLGSVGIEHDTYGRAVVGTQWAPTYAVTGVADKPVAFANDYLTQDYQGATGSGRADNMISYTNKYVINKSMKVNYGVGFQGSSTYTTGGEY